MISAAIEGGNPPARRAFPRLRRLGRAIESALAATGACFIIYHLCFRASVITSESMAPTLRGTSVETGDLVLEERVTYLFRDPRRWEIVAFDHPWGMRIMKRVVGLPGERVTLAEGKPVIDGEPAPMPAKIATLEYLAYGNLSKGRTAECGEGYYVLGDFSRDSQDSRFDETIRPERIKGRAWLILWPLSRMGFVNP